MVPKPQEQLGEKTSQPAPGDDVGDKVVISGIAGLFPDSYDVKQLSEILYNKKNPIRRTDRWDFNHPEVSQYAGNIPDPAHFDAQFFKVHYRLCNLMDPMSRKLLEQTYQAIFDSGYSPESLSGKKIGVYIGTCFSETEKACLYLPNVKTGLCIAGCNRSMFANRISYYLNLKGPSMSIDVSCTSSASALEMAYSSISRGECDGAIVGGANLCLHPQTVIHYGRAIDICMDGKTKSFDAKADGCSKSEAINVVFLQKAKDALRIYAYVVHAKCEYLSLPECETGAKYGFHSKPADLTRFYRTFYKEANVLPQDVQYVEAFGSANRDSDKLELDVLDEIFCKDRNEPLMVGSVMSNIGYVEAASATTSLTKILLGYHHGKLAGNLHYKTPRDDIAAIRDGRIEVLADNKEFVPTYTAINGMSITGNMAHILLHGYYKKKDLNKYKSSIPRIVLCSGRQESSVKKIIDDLKSRPIDPEEHALLHNFHEERTTGHLGRGYVILDTNEDNETVALSEDCNYFDEGKRPLWFVYSGMGSQWAEMGKDLMRIPVFAAAIEKCHRVLEPRGVNIIDIITSNDKNIFDNILHSFVGINAIQIGLTDVLRAVDITPDMIIGHSMGEICCAYADGCFTAEEAILCAYSRGLVSIQTPFIHGSMAAVGLGFKEISKICPPEIEVACHNSAESCTISGPAKIMGEFVASLVEQGIFAKEVACSNIAYHSRYVADAAPALLKFMQDLIQTPRPRSSRWVSTSVPQDRWDEPLAKYSSPEYHLNNLLSPVLFEEASQLIPSDAVLIEIGPHGLLQAILKRSLPQTCLNLPLTLRGHAKGCQYLLEAIGKLYMEGFIPKVKGLYPQVEFPVSTSTPMLSHLVEWAHQEIWFLPLPSALTIRTAAESITAISIFDPEHSYLKGHVMRGNNLYSFSAALVYVWDTLAASLSLKPKSISVQFENVHFYSQPLLHKQRQLLISVAIHKGTGHFEVLSEKSLIVRGTIIHEITGARKEQNACTTDMNVCKEDVYLFLHARDYHYHGDFRSIHSVNEFLMEAQIEWKDNWVTFLDGIIQLNFIRRKHHTVSKLNFIRKIIIDVNKQHTSLVTHDNKVLLNAQILELDDSTICGGVVMENLKFVDLPLLCDDGFILETPELFPSTHFETIKKSSGELHYLPLDDAYINEDNNNKNISPCSTLRIGQIGDVDSLYWIKTSPRDVTGVEIEVSYAGVNVVFVNKLLGSIFNETEERNKSVIDFSGVSKSGTRVMGMVRSDSISTKVTADPEFLLPVPWHWTLEDAATVPLSYSLAFYILFVKVNITKNYPLLIQGGAGALGQALISIALAHGCEVFTTVSSNSKKQFLQKLFPQLQDDHIGCSRDISFVDCILSATEGNGCQLVVSCSKDQNKNFLLQCLGFNGVLVDPTVIHNHEDFNYGMNYLTKQRGYLPIDLSAIFQPKYIEDARQIRDLMIEGIRRGYVRPLSRVTFAAEEAARACRMQAARCNRGRVLLDLQQVQSSVLSRVEFANSSWNLIISDNEIMALKLGERLVNRGATKLLFILCNVSRCVDIQSRLWESEGIEVKLIKAFWKGINLCKIIEERNYDGGLESVFIITSNEKAMDMKNIVKNFSAFISKLCSSTKYFAVISSFKEESESFFTALANDNITLIKIQGMNLVCDDICDNNEKLSVNYAIDAIEKALCSHKKMILAHSYTAPRKTLLQQILKIADLTVEGDITNDCTLSELYVDDSKLLAIQGYLQDIYEVYLSIEEIQKLTTQSIKEIERKCVMSDFSETRGVKRYFPKLYTDELLYSTEIIVMSTLASINMSDYINTEDTYLCIIPGVEGHYSRFTEFCKRLKLPALTLQPGLDHPNETVTEQANRYIQILSRKAVLKDNFYLLGYESGALVALEMAAVLEKRGLAGTIFCVGGSPEDIIADFKNSLNNYYRSNEELEMAVLKNAYSLITSEETDALDELCKNLKWSDKINICTETFKGKFPYSIQYTRKWIDLMYSKLTSLLRYIPEIKRLKSQIIYLRTQVTDTDSILRYCSEKNVISYELEAPLSSALQDLSCTSIVNQHLHSHIKSKFNNRNICITYQVTTDVLNATS